MACHRWVREGSGRADAGLLPAVDAHRRRRGPYTAAGTIVRALMPDAVERVPDLVAAHGVEILTVAPETRDAFDSTYAIQSALSPDQETTRFFSRLRTLRLSHGLTEFLRDYVIATGRGPVSLTVRRADEADPTDQEFCSVLLRRLDPRLIALVVEAASPAPGPLREALTRYAEPSDGPRDQAVPERTAAEHVAGDCLGPDSAGRAAYRRLPDSQRRLLHDRRADELEATGEYTWRLGAIPFHRERGGDPARAATALREAIGHCLNMGFYAAAIDLGLRARTLVGWSEDPEARYRLTGQLATAYIAFGRPDEAEVLYEEVRQHSTDPSVHMSMAYATGILLTRHYEEERRDHARARGRLNEAVAIAALLPDSPRLALQKVFNKVGLALIENHTGNRQAALRRVSEGLDLIPDTDDTGAYRLPRSILHLRRAQIYTGLNRLDLAVAEYRLVLADDPDYAEYHLELGNMLRTLGRDDEALVEYDTAIGLSPPFAEAYYNRADIRATRGEPAAALADFGYVVELTPDDVDAHINRAGILAQLDEAQEASDAVNEGLAIAPDNAHLLCLRGQLDLADGRPGPARAALDRAIETDPELAAAWATRGELAFESDDPAGALADLSRAWELSRDEAVLFNRAVVHQELRNWAEAAADFGQVLERGFEEEEALLRRATCRAQAGDLAGSAEDARRFAALAPHRAAEAAHLLTPAETARAGAAEPAGQSAAPSSA